MKATFPSRNGRRRLSDMFEGDDFNEAEVRTWMDLVDVDTKANEHVFSLSQMEQRYFCNWAYRVHLSASDNRIEQVLKPEFLR